jgi:hypothetical protein
LVRLERGAARRLGAAVVALAALVLAAAVVEARIGNGETMHHAPISSMHSNAHVFSKPGMAGR